MEVTKGNFGGFDKVKEEDNTQDYKWKIEYVKELKKFQVMGFVKVDGKWKQDGSAVSYDSMIDCFHNMLLEERNTSRTHSV